MYVVNRGGPIQSAPTLLAILLFVLTACTGSVATRPVPPPPSPEPTPVPHPVSLPADERSHADALEWWYYNGHLQAGGGREFGFHFVIFQTRDAEGQPGYAAELAITDVEGNRHFNVARFDLGEQPAGSGVMNLVIDEWALDIGGGTHRISAAMEDGSGIDLELAPSTPPMLHNEIGWLGGPFGWTYYYSWPRMDASGSIRLDGTESQVTGEGWFDHQWGDFFAPGAPAGWQWLALQLDDGSSLMITESRNLNGNVEALYGTLMEPDGSTRHITAGANGISLNVTDQWTSPHTGATYPAGWRVRVESAGIDLTLEPVVADQEITGGLPQAALYWEGKVRVTDSSSGERAGQGYAELAGYVQPPPLEWRQP